MEVSSANLEALSGYLQKTLSSDPNIRRPAEKYLESVEGNENYPVLLLRLIDQEQMDLMLRVTCAITFKNYVKRNWSVRDVDDDKISENDRLQVKSLVIGLMLKNPEAIQRQLSEAVSIIGREDFPAKWMNLISELVNHIKVSGGNLNVVNGVLQTAHSICKRYRHEFRSDKLWSEIKYVLDNFAKPLTELFVVTCSMAKQNANNAATLKQAYQALVLCTKIYYSLNVQDLPEFFEDNMSTWTSQFLDLLTTSYPILETRDDEEAGLQEQLKSQICDNISIYAQKYNEEFAPHIESFMTNVWSLLVSTSTAPKYDLLVSTAIRFLSTIADRIQYKTFFERPGVLDSLCSKVIIPNMEFRQSDEEMFEDNPEEYIRRDIEGSDIDTRRRAACDLVKSLSRYFEPQITSVFGNYIETMLKNFAINPIEYWKSKDAAVYLVTSIAVKGAVTRLGTQQTSQLINVVDFYRGHIRPDLERSVSQANELLPVLRADALKYIVTFRNQLDLQADLIGSLSLMAKHLTVPQIVVHTYAAHAIEKLFTMREAVGSHQTLIKANDIKIVESELLVNLFSALDLPGSNENEYVMKCIMRCFSLMRNELMPYLVEVIPKLIGRLTIVAKNPSKPHFNHFLFESLSLAIRYGCQSGGDAFVTGFESVVFPCFQQILVNDVCEFTPYVFQILSLLLEYHQQKAGNQPIPEIYMELFQYLLVPGLWERPANIAPLVRLLQAFIEKNSEQIVAAGKLENLLGIFQQLIASKSNDHQGFYLLQSIIEHTNPNHVSPYLKQVFILLFKRLTNSKTTKFVRSLLVFLSLFAYKYGCLVELIDSIQPQMFGMVIQRLVLVELQRLDDEGIDRKICAVGLTKLLTEERTLIDGQYASLWSPMLEALIKLFELPPDDTIPDDEHFIEIDETPGYQASYSQLVFAGRKPNDIFDGKVGNPRHHLAISLQKLFTVYPGKYGPKLSAELSPQAAVCLNNYLREANVAIV